MFNKIGYLGLLQKEYWELKLKLDRYVVAAEMKKVFQELLLTVELTAAHDEYKTIRMLELFEKPYLVPTHRPDFVVENPISLGWLMYGAWASQVSALIVISRGNRRSNIMAGNDDVCLIWPQPHLASIVYPNNRVIDYSRQLGIFDSWQLETICPPLRREDVKYHGWRWNRRDLRLLLDQPFQSRRPTILVSGLYLAESPGRSIENIQKAEFMQDAICNFPEELTFVK